MKWGLLLAIRMYWLLWPRSRRRQCLFAESCSAFVYRHARQLGLLAGLRALRERVKHCRGGWEICTTADGISLGLRLVDGTVIPEAEVAPGVLAPFRQATRLLEARLSAEAPVRTTADYDEFARGSHPGPTRA